jgi:hypothetical protein
MANALNDATWNQHQPEGFRPHLELLIALADPGMQGPVT